MSDLVKRIRASISFDAINGDSFERGICENQMREAAKRIEEQQKVIMGLHDTVAELEAHQAKMPAGGLYIVVSDEGPNSVFVEIETGDGRSVGGLPEKMRDGYRLIGPLYQRGDV